MNVKKVTTESELEQAFHIRKAVFVAEQGVPLADEIDEFDVLNGLCEHILVYYNEKPVGTARLRVVDDFGKLERICILKPYRKLGLGKVIVDALEDLAKKKGLSKLKLNSQTRAEGFYQKLGFKTASDVFMEVDIPHVLMVKEL